MKGAVFSIFLSCLLIGFSESKTEAQLWKLKRWEAVTGVGPTMFFCDIGGFSKEKNILGIRDISLLQTGFNFDLSLKYRITQDINARLSLATGFLHATDERGSNIFRGYEATTSIFGPTIIGEYYFIKNSTENSYLFSHGKRNRLKGGIIKVLDFYLLAGIGGLNYSVKGNDALVNYGIEPGGFTAVIPFGLGSTMIFSPDFNFGVELAGRYSFSDNLDGFTSQYSRLNDVYYFLNLTVTYKLRSGPNGFPTFK